MDTMCRVGDTECVYGRLKRGLCEKHYQRLRRHGSTDSTLIDNWSRYIVDPEGCWLWTGPVYKNGYGQLSRVIFGTQLAHRAFFIRRWGPIDRTEDLDHLCRVRHCVNTEHLELCDHGTNLRRGAGSYNGTRTTCRKGLHNTTQPGALRTNSNGSLECLECWRIRYRAAGQRYRDKLKAERGSTRPAH